MADENPPDLGRFSGTGPAPLDRARKHVHDHGPNDDSRGNAGTMEAFEPVEELTGDLSRGVIVICDHASGARVSLVWHSALPCHFKVQKLERTVVTLKADLSRGQPARAEPELEAG